mgnify:CR=1 FL=1
MTSSPSDAFIAWQCRIRQMSIRDHAGQPLDGMKARVEDGAGEPIGEAITTLIIHQEPEEATDLFRHIVKKTHDPKSRRDEALKLLSSTHYQYPKDFSDRLTALFSGESELAGRLIALGHCQLTFSQFGQTFEFRASVTQLSPDDAAWQATFWHNHMFNPALSEAVVILQFGPQWSDQNLP